MTLATILGDSRHRRQVGVKFPRDDLVTPTPGGWAQPAFQGCSVQLSGSRTSVDPGSLRRGT